MKKIIPESEVKECLNMSTMNDVIGLMPTFLKKKGIVDERIIKKVIEGLEASFYEGYLYGAGILPDSSLQKDIESTEL